MPNLLWWPRSVPQSQCLPLPSVFHTATCSPFPKHSSPNFLDFQSSLWFLLSPFPSLLPLSYLSPLFLHFPLLLIFSVEPQYANTKLKCTHLCPLDLVALRKLAALTLVTVGARVCRVALTSSIAGYATVADAMHAAAHCRQKTGIFFSWPDTEV